LEEERGAGRLIHNRLLERTALIAGALTAIVRTAGLVPLALVCWVALQPCARDEDEYEDEYEKEEEDEEGRLYLRGGRHELFRDYVCDNHSRFRHSVEFHYAKRWTCSGVYLCRNSTRAYGGEAGLNA